MSHNKLVLVDCDGWQGLYLNGELVAQGHTVDVLGCLPLPLCIDEYTAQTADYSWMEGRGYLPDNLSDVKVEE